MLVNNIVDFSNLIVDSTLSFGQGAVLSKCVIKDINAVGNSNRKMKLPITVYDRNFITDSEYIGSFTITKEVIGGENVYNFTKISGTSDYVAINPQYMERLKGTYVRFGFETANSQSGAPIRFSVTDGVKTILYLPNGNQTDKTLINDYRLMEFLFYIDKNATTFGFNVSSWCAIGQSVFIKNFNINPACYDLSAYSEMI